MGKRLDVPGVELVEGKGGLPAVRVSSSAESNGSGGLLYLHGGHVAEFRPAGGEDVLWVSEKSLWAEGKAIRGGVPICFPWFGPREGGEGPAHGFARLMEWELEGVRAVAKGVEVVVRLTSDEATRRAWPHDFVLRHRVVFGAELAMRLELTNTSTLPLKAEMAQHTYFAVGDVRQVRIDGLSGLRYIDKVDGKKVKQQERDVTFTGETDRVYLDATAPVTVDDPVKVRRVLVVKENSRDTVVWNPWIAKARAMADFGDEEWPGMVCVETANVGEHAVMLRPGETWEMMTRVASRRR